MKILISACLLGRNCRYDSGNSFDLELNNLLEKHETVGICPEVLGGMYTPRNPVEIVDLKAINDRGVDLTKQFLLGAEMALKIALREGCDLAILKSKSPSCGKSFVYDGSFSNKLVKGMGYTAKILTENGIKILDENEAKNYLKEVKRCP